MAQGKIYSLATYVLTITVNDESLANQLGLRNKTFTLGGQGSYTDSITISQTNTIWSTSADDTGSWVHTKSYKQNGTVSISLNQLSDAIETLRRICNCYYNGIIGDSGLTIVVTNNDSNKKVATCNDCYVSSIPSVEFSSDVGNQSWSFTCGQIIFGE